MRAAIALSALALVGTAMGIASKARTNPNVSGSSAIVSLHRSQPCLGTRVEFGRNSRVPGAVPWISARSADAVYLASLLYYNSENVLADGRANQAATLVAYAHLPLRLRWRIRASKDLKLTARRLDSGGKAAREIHVQRPRRVFVTSMRLTEGCWDLAVSRSGARIPAHVRVSVVKPPTDRVCDATPLHATPNKVVGNSHPWLVTIPRKAKLYAIGSIAASGNTSSASIYTDGRYPSGAATKVLWIPGKLQHVGGTLTIIGRRLDAPGSFRQIFQQTNGVTPPLVGPMFPSIPTVPSQGCWLLTVRTGSLGAFAIFSALRP